MFISLRSMEKSRIAALALVPIFFAVGCRSSDDRPELDIEFNDYSNCEPREVSNPMKALLIGTNRRLSDPLGNTPRALFSLYSPGYGVSLKGANGSTIDLAPERVHRIVVEFNASAPKTARGFVDESGSDPRYFVIDAHTSKSKAKKGEFIVDDFENTAGGKKDEIGGLEVHYANKQVFRVPLVHRTR